MSETNKTGFPATICPQCGYEGEPFDALYYLHAAAMLIPMSYQSLRKFLSRHRDEFAPLYGHDGPGRRRYRLLTGQEIKRIRAMLVVGPQRGGHDDLWRRILVSTKENVVETKENLSSGAA